MTPPATRATIRRPLAALAGTCLAVVLTSCASEPTAADGVGGSTNEKEPSAASSSARVPELGADEVLMSVRYLGPLPEVPPPFGRDFVLLGDGTAILFSEVPADDLGPAIQPLQAATFSEQQIEDLYAAADTANLLDGEVDYGAHQVEGQSPTSINIAAGEVVSQQMVESLGVDEDPASGLTEPQILARQALAGFIETAYALVDADSEPYYGTDVEVVELSADLLGVTPGQEQEPMVWPIATTPTRPCAIITGSEAAELQEALTAANYQTPWLVGSDPSAYFGFRPVFPGDPACSE